MNRKRQILLGSLLIVLAIVCAGLEAYKEIHVSILGVALAAFGGRLIGEAYKTK